MEILLLLRAAATQRSTLLAQFTQAGIEARVVDSIEACLSRLRDRAFDAVVVLDSGPSTGEWLDLLCGRCAPAQPVLVLGGPGGGGLFDAIQRGATDFACDIDSLLNRLHARVGVHRRTSRKTARLADLVLDFDLGLAWRGSTICMLTAREFALAYELANADGAVVTVQNLSLRVWGCSSDISKRTIEQHVHRLRKKLCMDGKPGNRIQAVYGHGYRMDLRSAEGPMERRKGGRPASEWTLPLSTPLAAN